MNVVVVIVVDDDNDDNVNCNYNRTAQINLHFHAFLFVKRAARARKASALNNYKTGKQYNSIPLCRQYITMQSFSCN